MGADVRQKIKSSHSGISVTLPPRKMIGWPPFFDASGRYVVLADNAVQILDVQLIGHYSLSELHGNGCMDQYHQVLATIIENQIE